MIWLSYMESIKVFTILNVSAKVQLDMHRVSFHAELGRLRRRKMHSPINQCLKFQLKPSSFSWNQSKNCAFWSISATANQEIRNQIIKGRIWMLI